MNVVFSTSGQSGRITFSGKIASKHEQLFREALRISMRICTYLIIDCRKINDVSIPYGRIICQAIRMEKGADKRFFLLDTAAGLVANGRFA